MPAVASAFLILNLIIVCLSCPGKLTLQIYVIIYSIGNGCRTTFMDMDLLIEKAAQISMDDGKGELSDKELDEGLWIMPSTRFKCSGNITSLLIGVVVKTEGTRYPSIELWRQMSMDPLMFEKVPRPDTERYITLDASQFSTTGPYQYNITPPLPYDDGDVLAVRQPGNDAKVRFFYQTDSANQIYKVRPDHTTHKGKFQSVLISLITSKLL